LTRRVDDPDELARAAGSLIQAVQNEQNPKFQNSAFLGLMRQLRDGEVTVEGDKMVPKEGGATETIGGWVSEFQVSSGTKGKGKAVERPIVMNGSQPGMSMTTNLTQAAPTTALSAEALRAAEEEIDEYFRQENDAYIQYHDRSKIAEQRPGLPAGLRAQNAEWDTLQGDWSRFEATANGLRPIANYQFSANNPYLHSETTKHHSTHSTEWSLYEVCAYYTKQPYRVLTI
jgi:peroxin-5